MSSTLSLNLSKKLFYDDLADQNRQKNQPIEKDVDRKDMYLGGSMAELGQIAILNSSRLSLRRQSSNYEKDIRDIASIRRKESLKLIGQPLSEKQQVDYEKEESNKKGCLAKLSEFKGSIYGMISAFGFCASNVVMKKTIYLAPTDHSAIRYIVTLIFMVIVCKYNDLKLLGPRKQFKLLLARGVIGSLSLLCFYFAIMLLNPSDSTTLVHSSIIITAVLSRLFLGEKLTFAHFLAIVLTANGVMFISKPDFLFPKVADEYDSTNQTDSIRPPPVESTFEKIKPILGNDV